MTLDEETVEKMKAAHRNATANKPDLLDCPCCSNAATISQAVLVDEETDEYVLLDLYHIQCTLCGLRTQDGNDMYQLAATWNQRPDQDTLPNPQNLTHLTTKIQ